MNKKSLDLKVELVVGDITTRDVDIIVNAANSSLCGGGGVDGAIHRAAGAELLRECLILNGCETGEARITRAYDIPVKYIIHTVGPIWDDFDSNNRKRVDDLESCYMNCLRMAEMQGANSIAFPCISTGVYRFPKRLAARVVLEAIKTWEKENYNSKAGECGHYLSKIEIVCFDQEDADIYREVWQECNG